MPRKTASKVLLAIFLVSVLVCSLCVPSSALAWGRGSDYHSHALSLPLVFCFNSWRWGDAGASYLLNSQVDLAYLTADTTVYDTYPTATFNNGRTGQWGYAEQSFQVRHDSQNGYTLLPSGGRQGDTSTHTTNKPVLNAITCFNPFYVAPRLTSEAWEMTLYVTGSPDTHRAYFDTAYTLTYSDGTYEDRSFTIEKPFSFADGANVAFNDIFPNLERPAIVTDFLIRVRYDYAGTEYSLTGASTTAVRVFDKAAIKTTNTDNNTYQARAQRAFNEEANSFNLAKFLHDSIEGVTQAKVFGNVTLGTLMWSVFGLSIVMAIIKVVSD